MDMLHVFGTPKYLLKCEATYIQDQEHWFAVLDKQGGVLCRVPLLNIQAEMLIDKERLETISAARFSALINER